MLLLDKKYTKQNTVPVEEKLEENGARLEHSLPKSPTKLTQEVQVLTAKM
jgi:hypothetical protein